MPKNRTNRALGRQGPQKRDWISSGVVTFGIGGRGGASRALSMFNKTTGSIKGDVVCHADGRWPGEFYCMSFYLYYICIIIRAVLYCIY